MRPFIYRRAASASAANEAALASPVAVDVPPTEAPVQFLAGGTTILDLMKLDVMRPQALVDINPLRQAGAATIEAGADSLRSARS